MQCYLQSAQLTSIITLSYLIFFFSFAFFFDSNQVFKPLIAQKQQKEDLCFFLIMRMILQNKAKTGKYPFLSPSLLSFYPSSFSPYSRLIFFFSFCFFPFSSFFLLPFLLFLFLFRLFLSFFSSLFSVL